MEAADPISPTTLPNTTHFDSPDFNPVTWLNSSLTPTTPLPPLLHLLQDSLRDAHVTLDTSLSTALSSVPWVVRETDKVRQRANLLRAGVDGVGQRVEGVETGVVSSVSTIAAADTVVRRVQRASDLLAQAVEAERLLARLDALLASSAGDGSDLVSAADVVSKLRTTLGPLKPIPELEDRFEQLDESDRKLEALAAPQLKRALEGRGTAAAKNARIVFDHAGRDNAFQTQYVALRGEQVGRMWTTAWETREMVVEGTEGIKGDLAAVGVEAVVVGFYAKLFEMIRVEAEWLREAFPDLRDQLLPMLICEAVGGLKDPLPISNVFVRGGGDTVDEAKRVGDRLFGVGMASVTASGRICRLLLPDGFGQEEDEGGLGRAVVSAITALMQPFRAFWNSATQVALRQARTSAAAMKLPCSERTGSDIVGDAGVGKKPSVGPTYATIRPALGELARDVESCNTEVLAVLDSMLTTLNQRTSGVGIGAMKMASNALAASLNDRLCRVLRLPVGLEGPREDEWAKISGALRLLIAASALKRSWDARKESLFAVAVGTATPVLEIASVVHDAPVKRVEQFLFQIQNSDHQEAAIAWELVRDNNLTAKVVTEFESLDSGAHDLENFINLVHRVVYDTMFTGVKERFSSFSARDLWSAIPADGEANMLGFSSSPLGYATEVADFLMTIPQQLEPFVPDEEDAKYAAPTSPYLFSKSGAASSGHRSTSGNGGQPDTAASGLTRDDEHEDDLGSMSFAGMWISLLAVGTMELYVEKICSIPKMSEAGTRQLATDADYICNIIASLGVAPTPDMALVSRLLECHADAASVREIATDFQTAEQRKLIRKVAAVRGISVAI